MNIKFDPKILILNEWRIVLENLILFATFQTGMIKNRKFRRRW
jgi:hypothetical protein